MIASRKKALSFSLRHTYPMLISWAPVALAYALIMKNAGYNALWTGFSCLAIPFGSLGMVAVSFYLSSVPLLVVGLTAAAMASRHLFYGISFLDRFKKYGPSRFYMIYMLCDELYSLYCAYEIPQDTDEKWVHIFSALLLQIYWVSLTMVCSLLGSLIPFDLTGVEFALTALFTTILIDMIRSNSTPLPAVIGAIASILSFVLFGAEQFLLPALLITVAALTLLRGKVEPGRKELTPDGD